MLARCGAAAILADRGTAALLGASAAGGAPPVFLAEEASPAEAALWRPQAMRPDARPSS